MIALVLSCWNLSVAAQSTVITNAPASNNVDPAVVSDPMVLPPSVPDPIEPVNRAIWGFNRGVMTWVVKPTGKVYRTVVRKPIRTAISNLGYHVKYPGRLVNNLLQGRWHGARDETYRSSATPWSGEEDYSMSLRSVGSPSLRPILDKRSAAGVGGRAFS